MLAVAELLAAIKCAKSYPAGNGKSYFHDMLIGNPEDASARLAGNLEAIVFG